MLIGWIVGAGALAGLVLALAWRPWRRSEPRAATRAATTMAFALAYATVYVGVHGGGPPWPPKEAGHWLVLLVVASPLLGGRGALLGGLRAAAVAAFLWTGLEPLRVHRWEAHTAAPWLGGLFLVWVALLASRADLARRVRGADPALTALVTCVGTALVLGQRMGSAGLLAGGLSAACCAWLALALWRPDRPIAGPAWTALGLALPGLMVVAAFFSGAPAASCALLAATPEVGRVDAGPRGGWRATLVHAFLAAALCGLAFGLALPEGATSARAGSPQTSAAGGDAPPAADGGCRARYDPRRAPIGPAQGPRGGSAPGSVSRSRA